MSAYFTYDGRGLRLTAQDLHDTADATFGTWTYTYDDAGNLSSLVDPKSQTINFTYDESQPRADGKLHWPIGYRD